MTGKKNNIALHLDDIDFRTRETRQASIKEDLSRWYIDLHRAAKLETNERLEGQITMLSSVLWYVLDPKEYKALIKRAL